MPVNVRAEMARNATKSRLQVELQKLQDEIIRAFNQGYFSIFRENFDPDGVDIKDLISAVTDAGYWISIKEKTVSISWDEENPYKVASKSKTTSKTKSKKSKNN